MKKSTAVIVAILAFTLVLGLLLTSAWGAFDANKPTNARAYVYRDDDIRANQTALQTAYNSEHEFSGTAAATQEGFHRAGSAVAQYGSSLALTRPDGTAFDANDGGRLGVDSDTMQLYVYDNDEAAFLPLNGSYVDVRSYGADDTDDTDDSNAIQQAIDAALSNHQPLYIPRTSTTDAGYYRIETALTIGSGVTYAGVRIVGDRWPVLKWCGAEDSTILTITGLAESTIDGICIDGNDISGCIGVLFQTDGSHPSQRNVCDHLWVTDANSVGVKIVQTDGATLDYLSFRQCVLDGCGIGMQIQGGSRQIDFVGGTIAECTTYGIDDQNGVFTGYDLFFGLNGTSDIYLNGSIASFSLFGGASESGCILTNSSVAETGTSLVGPITITGLNQAAITPDTNVVDYTGGIPIIFTGCKFQGNVVLSSNVPAATSVGCQFSTGDFTGTCTKLTRWLPDENKIVIGNYLLYFDGTNLQVDGGSSYVETRKAVSHSYGSGSTPWELTSSEAMGSYFTATSAGGAVDANFPAVQPGKVFVFYNNSGQAVTVQVDGETGTEIANGKKAVLSMDASDVVEIYEQP